MGNKYIRTRIQNKYGTEAEWKASDFIPLRGEIIVYDMDQYNSSQRLKIGNGTTNLTNLPFLSSGGYCRSYYN